MPDNKTKKRNKKNARTKEDNIALPYEAARAYSSAGEDTDPLGSWTGTARTGEAGPPAGTNNVPPPGGAGTSGILLPPRERAPRGGDMLPGASGLPGGPFPVGEPVQHGVPGGKTYLNVKSSEGEAPSQDADDL